MTSKDALQKEKDLYIWWSAVVNDPKFDKVHLIMQTDVLKMPSIDKQSGAIEMLEALREVAYVPPAPASLPSSGLIHETPKHTFQTS